MVRWQGESQSVVVIYRSTFGPRSPLCVYTYIYNIYIYYIYIYIYMNSATVDLAHVSSGVLSIGILRIVV